MWRTKCRTFQALNIWPSSRSSASAAAAACREPHGRSRRCAAWEFIAREHRPRQALLMSDADRDHPHRRGADAAAWRRRELRGGLPGRRGEPRGDSAGAGRGRHGASSPPARAAARAPGAGAHRVEHRLRGDRAPLTVGAVTKPFSFEGRIPPQPGRPGHRSCCPRRSTRSSSSRTTACSRSCDKKTTMLDAFRIATTRCARASRASRPHHHPRPHQPRLRGHPHSHEGRRHGHDGHRHFHGREPRAGRGPAGHLFQPAESPPSPVPRACCSPSPAARISR
ncbi:MAG: hypothetical protein ACLTDR_08495 [Adlercreutzia equolifaciens]